MYLRSYIYDTNKAFPSLPELSWSLIIFLKSPARGHFELISTFFQDSSGRLQDTLFISYHMILNTLIIVLVVKWWGRELIFQNWSARSARLTRGFSDKWEDFGKMLSHAAQQLCRPVSWHIFINHYLNWLKLRGRIVSEGVDCVWEGRQEVGEYWVDCKWEGEL